MNWVDAALLAAVVISAMLAFSRGLVREVLGIAAWVGAVFFATSTVAMLRPTMRGLIHNPDIADPAAYVAMFLLGLIVLSIVTGVIGNLVRTSMLGGIDRTLGVVFGIARAIVMAAAAYIAAGWLLPTDRWPEPVQQARSLPYVYEMAAWLVKFLPPEYRPGVPPPPPGWTPTSAALLQPHSRGNATDRP